MAKKSTRKRSKPDPHDAAIDAALRLAGERGWRGLTLADIAEAGGLSLAELHDHFGSKTAILRAFMTRVDQAVLAEDAGFDADEPARDRLFDVTMRRFDALKPHRKGLAAILQDQTGDPLAALCLLPGLRKSMTAMLGAAGISSAGCRGALRVKGLGLIYLASLRVFFRDESDDLANTMAALDKQLGRADKALGCVRKVFRSRRPPSGETSVTTA